MDETLNTGSSWQSFIQGAASKLIDRTYDVREIEMTQRGEQGYYQEGRPGTFSAKPGSMIGGLSPTVLLIGGAAIVALLLLRR